MARNRRPNPWIRKPNGPAVPVPVFVVGDRVASKGGSLGSVIDLGRHHDGTQILVIRWDRDPDLSEMFATDVILKTQTTGN